MLQLCFVASFAVILHLVLQPDSHFGVLYHLSSENLKVFLILFHEQATATDSNLTFYFPEGYVEHEERTLPARQANNTETENTAKPVSHSVPITVLSRVTR